MTTILPEGDDIRKAVKWIGEERSVDPLKNAKALIEEACLKFDLSPVDSEFIARFVREKKFIL